METSALVICSLMVSRNEKSSLCFSNKDLQIFLYSISMKKSFKMSMRSLMSDDSADLKIAVLNKLMKNGNEYWYMGSMLAKSAMQKNNTDTWNATGTYCNLASSIFCSVSSATFCFSAISLESCLEDDRTWTADSSSKMLPCDELSTSRILFSVFSSCSLFSAPSTTRRAFSSARSGRSRSTTMFSSWSCRPTCVIMKFSSVTLTATSGR
mmetsp:Transcript_83467/g.221143  ORF Transcript_83467/g.221143 Transcript_83467/m.221143 type:complete len:210 (-) Transcript_83467:216-845(-)